MVVQLDFNFINEFQFIVNYPKKIYVTIKLFGWNPYVVKVLFYYILNTVGKNDVNIP